MYACPSYKCKCQSHVPNICDWAEWLCCLCQFAGFSAESLCERIIDSHCSLLITAGKSHFCNWLSTECFTLWTINEAKDIHNFLILWDGGGEVRNCCRVELQSGSKFCIFLNTSHHFWIRQSCINTPFCQHFVASLAIGYLGAMNFHQCAANQLSWIPFKCYSPGVWFDILFGFPCKYCNLFMASSNLIVAIVTLKLVIQGVGLSNIYISVSCLLLRICRYHFSTKEVHRENQIVFYVAMIMVLLIESRYGKDLLDHSILSCCSTKYTSQVCCAL